MQLIRPIRLHNRPLVIRVAYKEGGEPDGRGGVYGPSNEIKQYKAVSQSAPQQAPAQQPSYPSPAAPLYEVEADPPSDAVKSVR